MEYAVLIYETPEDFSSRKDDEAANPYVGAWRVYHRSLVEAGIYVGGEPLHVPESATTVRVRDGKRQVQDGPYAATKEQLGGFIILELASLDLALQWAARCPAAARGAVEVRPMAPAMKQRVTSAEEAR
jgi:hypothetical protein